MTISFLITKRTKFLVIRSLQRKIQVYVRFEREPPVVRTDVNVLNNQIKF